MTPVRSLDRRWLGDRGQELASAQVRGMLLERMLKTVKSHPTKKVLSLELHTA